MLDFGNNWYLCQTASELPRGLIGHEDVYLDVETSSHDKGKDAFSPWHDCWLTGFSFTSKQTGDVFYFDYGRASAEDQYTALCFVQDLLWYAKTWTNQNIKYDAHVLINHGIQIPEWLKLRCTIVRAKLIDSDRGGARGGYGLEVLTQAWLQWDITGYEAALKPFLRGNKDYGKIPSDIIGIYGCVDSHAVKLLDAYIDARLPERCQFVANVEIELTKELVYLEQYGMRFIMLDLKMAQFDVLNRMMKIDARLAELVGRSFRPWVNEDCNEVLIGHYGLPIIKYTAADEGEEDEENASFDNKVLAEYAAMPYAPTEVIKLMQEYRKLFKRNNGYLTPWPILAPDGIIHPDYNQIVRTGRMSCKRPNAQQLDDFMASLIVPRDGNCIISTDASQIEYRMIIHYIQNKRCIDAFHANPDADFHDYIDDMVEAVAGARIGRRASKTLNFQHGFGAGQKSVIRALGANEDIIAVVKSEVDALGLEGIRRQAEYDRRLHAKGTAIYKAYHAGLPELKPTFTNAEDICKSAERCLGLAPDAKVNGKHYYGYITNISGRDRHLPYAEYRIDYKTKDPYDLAWLAFPTVNSSSAADLMKERFVCLMQHLRRNKVPAKAIALVHDEIVIEAPEEFANDPRMRRDFAGILEHPTIPIRVPIRWSVGQSNVNWLDASTDSKKTWTDVNGVKHYGKSGMVSYNYAECENFDWWSKA